MSLTPEERLEAVLQPNDINVSDGGPHFLHGYAMPGSNCSYKARLTTS